MNFFNIIYIHFPIYNCFLKIGASRDTPAPVFKSSSTDNPSIEVNVRGDDITSTTKARTLEPPEGEL